MRGPICIATEDNTTPQMKVRTFYLRRPWLRLGELIIFNKWDCIVWGESTGIEINVGKLHLELQFRKGHE